MMRKSCAALVSALVVFSSLPVRAQEPLDTTDKIFARFSDRIYVLGETNGGNEAAWAAEEAIAINALRKIGEKDPDQLGKVHGTGDSLLIRASYRGYAFLIEELLKYPQVVKTIPNRQREADAWMLSNFATRPGALVCNPDILSNPLALVPIIVTQPYYESRDPYPKIRALLEKAGAKADMAGAKAVWAKTCIGQSPETAKAVAEAPDMQAAVLGAGRAAFLNLMRSNPKR